MRKALLVAIFTPLLAIPAPAHATKRCGALAAERGYPGIQRIRAEHLSCRKARRVASAYQRRWQRTNEPPKRVRPHGMGTFRCVYHLHTMDNESSYGAVRCTHTRRSRRVVRFRVVS